jgi:predicted nucleic acid-binding protein
MTEFALILVDTNVLLDVAEQDECWAEWSQEQMNRYVGRMIVNPIIYAELCYQADNAEEVDAILAVLGVGLKELSRQALFRASRAFKLYRQSGGSKSAPLPDFFIGAHAADLGVPILTRDESRYQTYFPEVRLIAP